MRCLAVPTGILEDCICAHRAGKSVRLMARGMA